MKFKQNLFYAVAIGTLFILIEFLYRINHNELNVFLRIKEYFSIYLIFLILSFTTKKFANYFILFISSIFILQLIHFNYFGYLFFPIEFILFFTKQAEIFDTLTAELSIFLEPTIYLIVLFMVIKFINKKTINRITYKKANYIFIAIIIILLILNAIKYDKRGLGDRPNVNKSIIKNSLYVTKTFISKTLPLYLLDIQTLESWGGEKFKKNDNGIDNIVFIIGESLSLNHMSLYGYERDTTPNFNSMKNDKNFIFKKGLASGVYTDSSIPMFMNCALRPNSIPHILSSNTNLYKMAKKNGYKTYWTSTQANDGFSYIRNYIGLKYIDNYIDSYDYGYSKKDAGYDDIIYKSIKDIDLNKNKNFIVLNMMGSHSPYNERVPESFEMYPKNNNINHYDNSVVYTDDVVHKIIKYIKNSTDRKTLFIFTSDHGQSVNKVGGGHGNIENPLHYHVPMIFYTHNFEFDDNTQKQIQKSQWMSHYSMSLIIGNYLGYNTLERFDFATACVNGHELSGNAGYLNIEIENDYLNLKIK